MPANLNALIRYKTINSCLFGGKRKWTIQELQDACSEALAESRGRYEGISERTIRDDIRVMRSDILGFNAPIVQEKSLYFYSDPQFSILNLRITDAGLADKIYTFLMGLRDETMHPELENILEQLCYLTKKRYESPKTDNEEIMNERLDIKLKRCPVEESEFDEKSRHIKLRITDKLDTVAEEKEIFESDWVLSWGRILKGIKRDFN